MAKKPSDEIKFDEDLRAVEFEELERQKRRYRNIGNTIVILILLTVLVWLGWKFYNRRQSPPPAEPETTQNLWVPGIDYQPAPDEGN